MTEANPSKPHDIILNGEKVGEYVPTGDRTRDAETVRAWLKARSLLPEISRAQAIYNQAVAFCRTSDYLHKVNSARMSTGVQVAAPFVANTALAIELYLKALAEKYGKRIDTHKLLHLLSQLPLEAKEDIKTVTPRAAQQLAFTGDQALEPHLKSLNNAFVQWRYSFDRPKCELVEIQPSVYVMLVLHEAFGHRHREP